MTMQWNEKGDFATKHYVDSKIIASKTTLWAGKVEPTDWKVGDLWLQTDADGNAITLNQKVSDN